MSFKQIALIEIKEEDKEFEEIIITSLKDKGYSTSKLLNPKRIEVFKIEK